MSSQLRYNQELNQKINAAEETRTFRFPPKKKIKEQQQMVLYLNAVPLLISGSGNLK